MATCLDRAPRPRPSAAFATKLRSGLSSLSTSILPLNPPIATQASQSTRSYCPLRVFDFIRVRRFIQLTHFPRNITSRVINRNPEHPQNLPPTYVATMTTPQFWSTPLRYMRWASHEKPAIFYSLIIGATGPLMLVSLPPIRRFFGDVDPEPIPLTYPSKLPAAVPA